MHDRARRGVLHMHLAVGLDLLLDGKRGQRRLVKAAKNEFLLARVEVDIADGVDARL